MTTHPDLAKQIENIVQQHIETLRASAAAAVARAFAAASPPISARTSAQPRPMRPRNKAAPRRAAEELVALASGSTRWCVSDRARR